MRGVWIEIAKAKIRSALIMSLPMRGVWIEITIFVGEFAPAAGHSPCGECGLKLERQAEGIALASHSPCGECGLKSTNTRLCNPCVAVTPHAGSVD